MRNEKILGGAVIGMLAISGCPGPTNGTPDAYAGLDAPVIREDAGANDAFVPPGTDAFMAAGDAFMPPGTDAFVATPDAFMPPGSDAFVPWPTDPCTQIAMIRGMSGGTLPVARPVTGAVVTYVLAAQPAGATDPIGFFAQCPGASGPALFVTVDPATLSPAPAVGDVVSFDVTAAVDVASGAGSTGDQHRVTAITGYTRTATGMTVAPEDVSALDLPSMIDAHESEIVTISGTIAAAAAPAGTGYTSYQITTTGFPTAGPTLRVRIAASVASALLPAPTVGCTVAVGPTPLWRFTTTAQPMAWQASEVTVSCPTPVPAVGELFFSELGYQFAMSDDDKEFVELHNPSATVTYDLSGCVLSDGAGPTDAGAYTIPAGTLIGPGDYFVFAGSMSETTADLPLAAALGFDGDDTVQLHCGGTLIDAVTWTASGIGGADEVSAQLDLDDVTATGATNNDMVANWCSTPMGSTYGTARLGTPGAANVACMPPPACMPATHLVINEIDYDMEGTDNAEFVELYNPTSAAIDLTGHTLVAINGNMASGPEYARVALTGSIPAGGFVLVTATGSTVTGATLSLSAAMQNGAPDGILLLGPAGVLDAVIYEGSMPMYTLMGGSAMALMESASAGTDPAMGATGLSRRPDGCDRDTPAMDWAVAPITPGATNM